MSTFENRMEAGRKVRRSRKSRPAPDIIIAENDDRSQAIVKAGRHYARFHTGKEGRNGPLFTAIERARDHADKLAKSFKGKLNYRRAPGPRQGNIGQPGGVAIEYAVWLAKRDGITLPNVYGKPHFTTIPSAIERNAKGRPVMLTRCHSVTFGTVTIDIPNWNWEPIATPVKMAA